MEKYNVAVNNVYRRLNNSVIIGLTGRTGSGCSTASKILESDSFDKLCLDTPKKKDFLNIEERKHAIIYKYMKENWVSFDTIEVSSIILAIVFEMKYEDFLEKLESLKKEKSVSLLGFEELKKQMEKEIKELFESGFTLRDQNINDKSKDEIEKYYVYFTKTVKENKRKFYELFCDYSCYEEQIKNNGERKEEKEKQESQLYTYLLQYIGNNIRSSGKPFVSDFIQENLAMSPISEYVEKIIEIIKLHNQYNKKKTRICIDALRNPYEAYYLRDRYKEFYLVSVNTDDEERRRRLTKFDQEALESLDEMEYPNDFEGGKIFFKQSIKECLQMADIHLYNPRSSDDTYELLTENLVRYVALMIHPGLVTPTNVERCMQIAYNAKLNSGCLSRQVGAVITDENYYIKAIGWNEVPQGQISCGLRAIDSYFSDRDKDTFSKFELENSEFKESLNQLKCKYFCKDSEECKAFKAYNVSYCFKDVYNAIKNDKNQVYTRSLHAEENAFLQASKFGGQGILGGKLFVTASPCELCSKKAYQLGIKDIYFIDPYPGIAATHILKLGAKETNPDLHIFFGAIGNAYVTLYSQRFAVKDELQLVTGVSPKKVIKEAKKKSAQK